MRAGPHIEPLPPDHPSPEAVSSGDKMRAALQFAIDGYPRIDINHQDYRVQVYRVALDALGRSECYCDVLPNGYGKCPSCRAPSVTSQDQP